MKGSSMKLVLATRNMHKIEEIKTLLSDLPLEISTLHNFVNTPEVEEDGSSYAENALKKARVIHTHTGLPTLADDSGIEVHYLADSPGHRSARYAGPQATDRDNLEKLLNQMKGVPPRRRYAQYRCVVAFVGDGFEYTAEGIVRGTLGTEPRGSNGFGYDPLFYPIGSHRTFAELSPEEKNAVSHRAKAIEGIKIYIRTHAR